MKLDAYYYSFEATGVEEIDHILEAVALAGKAFHETSQWNDSCTGYSKLEGTTPVEWIQFAANKAASRIKSNTLVAN